MGNLANRLRYNQEIAGKQKPARARKKSVSKLKKEINAISPGAISAGTADPVKKRGRRPSASPKEVFAVRLDPELIKAIKASGDRWPVLVSDVLHSAFLPGPR